MIPIDGHVHIEKGRYTVEWLEKFAAVERLIFPDEIHDFLLNRHWIEAYRVASEFLDRRLKAGGDGGRTP